MITRIFIILLIIVTSLPAHSQDDELYDIDDDTVSILDFDTVIPVEHLQKETTIGKVAAVAIPATMITYGIISLGSDDLRQLDFRTKEKLQQQNMFLHHKVDDYMQYSPAAAALIMKMAGVPSEHKLVEMAGLYATSTLLMTTVAYSTKTIVSRARPDSSKDNSFPSGHTATAFVSAQFLHEEYGDKSIWISVGGYTMATLTGISRVFNDRHWVSDVITGAGIGILSVKLVYWVYPHIKNTVFRRLPKQAVVLPYYGNGGAGVNFSCSF